MQKARFSRAIVSSELTPVDSLASELPAVDRMQVDADTQLREGRPTTKKKRPRISSRAARYLKYTVRLCSPPSSVRWDRNFGNRLEDSGADLIRIALGIRTTVFQVSLILVIGYK